VDQAAVSGLSEETVRIAVASRNKRTVADHIGKCADWLVYTALERADDRLIISGPEIIRLPKTLIFHHYKGDQPHPLAGCVAVIGASAGGSFVEKMRARGIEGALTAESDPATAVRNYVHQQLAPARARPIGDIICKIRDALSG